VPVIGLFADIATHARLGATSWKPWVRSELSIQFQRASISTGQRNIDGYRFPKFVASRREVRAQFAIKARGRRRECTRALARRRMVMFAKAGSLYRSGFSGWCALGYTTESDGDILSVVRDADSLHFRYQGRALETQPCQRPRAIEH